MNFKLKQFKLNNSLSSHAASGVEYHSFWGVEYDVQEIREQEKGMIELLGSLLSVVQRALSCRV